MEATAGLFLTNYVYQVPVFIAWLIGLLVAISRWRRHPRPSLLIVIALAIFFLRALIGPALSWSVVHSDLGLENAGMVQGLISLLFALVAAVAWILLLVAALGWRSVEGPEEMRS